MSILTKTDLLDLDTYLDKDIASTHAIFNRPLEIALINLLKVYENYIRIDITGNEKK